MTETIRKILNDRYQVISMIGQGGMAFVYKAHDTSLERDVAIKIIRRQA